MIGMGIWLAMKCWRQSAARFRGAIRREDAIARYCGEGVCHPVAEYVARGQAHARFAQKKRARGRGADSC